MCIRDRYRSTLIIQHAEKKKLVDKIKKYSYQINNYLKEFDNLKNVRGVGYIIAFDLNSTKNRDRLVKKLFENGMLVNPTRTNTIRLRPHLDTSLEDIILFKKIFSTSINEIKPKK